jgi:hypothetical protein
VAVAAVVVAAAEVVAVAAAVVTVAVVVIQIAAAVIAAAAVDTVAKHEVRVSNQVRVQAKATKVVRSHNQVVAIAATKAATVEIESEFHSSS